ncbi:hypothetical protein, partial [Undibacterium squillarum]|uniref:hypothetical protein n=1 Tax=Undibacterium squillarum TaxID=1131567 RepID=UPI001E285980
IRNPRSRMRRGFCFVRAKAEKEQEQELSKKHKQHKPEKTNTNPAAAGFVLCRSENRPNAVFSIATPRSTAESPALRKGRMRMSAQIVFF